MTLLVLVAVQFNVVQAPCSTEPGVAEIETVGAAAVGGAATGAGTGVRAGCGAGGGVGFAGQRALTLAIASLARALASFGLHWLQSALACSTSCAAALNSLGHCLSLPAARAASTAAEADFTSAVAQPARTPRHPMRATRSSDFRKPARITFSF